MKSCAFRGKFRLVLCLFLLPGAALCQTPQERAWQMLQQAAASPKWSERVSAARALGLVTNNPGVLPLLQAALHDKEADVRSAAATSLGTIGASSAIPSLVAALQDKEGEVVMAAAKALVKMGNEEGYGVYYAIVTGTRKSGEGLIASNEKQAIDMLKNPKKLAYEALQQGIGYVPYGGMALQAVQTIQGSEKSDALVKAAAVRALAKDPDPRSGKALVGATSHPRLIVRAAAYDALARRGDPAVVSGILAGLDDKEQVVKLTAAAAITQLSAVKSEAGPGK
jgi:HEAT repeat protein